MSDDIEKTRIAAEATIARVDALLGDAQTLLARSAAELGAEATSPEFIRNYMARQPADAQAEFARAAQEVVDEIARDLPRTEAKPASARPRPMRQMV